MSKSSKKRSQSGKPTENETSPTRQAASAVPVQPVSPVVDRSPTLPATSTQATDSSVLIRFDKRVKITLGAFIGIFLLFVLFKWHYVSLPIWNTLLPDGSAPNRGLVAGTPKQIRMDDYAVGAPWILSNVSNEFGHENEGIGGLKAALLVSPTNHIVTVFKFMHWGFMLLDAERGYSWMYNSNPFLVLIGSFLFFLLVCRNNYLLSLTGALTLFLSSGTVRWSFIPAPMIGYCGLAFVAAIYVLKAQKPTHIALWALLLIWSVISYALYLYPPYQLPMVYLFAFVLVGYLINERKNLFPINRVPIRLGALGGIALVAGFVLYVFYNDVQETLKALSSTVYPGQRSETGGTGFIANAFSEYYSWFFDDQKFPKSWLNICELSHYLNFAPIIIPLSVLLFVKTRRIDWMIVGGSVFVLLMWIWMEVGFPKSLAKLSLMSMVPTRRGQVPMGIGAVVLLFLYLGALSTANTAKDEVKLPVWANAVAVIGIAAFMIYTAYVNINDSEGLIKPFQTFIPVVFFTMMGVLLVSSIAIPYRLTIFCTGLILFLLPNLKANPLSKGLSPITENAFFRTVKSLVEQNPNARWIVNGNQFITYMVTATGAKQITGVKYIPNRKTIMSVLDPKMKRDSAYNRYAHVTNQSYVDGKDSVVLVNQFEDGYIIAMDPCSPKMKQLNVKYQVFDHAPQPVEVRCMKQVATLGSLTIYQTNF
ncbi:DUF7657 domain-containing protein [Rudanella lutea]|uniref:DUF7657 domain-containing protein n=1 Tax=Rudanella lutea TaxID=451374 RepID=UPI0003AA1895|nr:hypothetical protein [Rudanella lutea]